MESAVWPWSPVIKQEQDDIYENSNDCLKPLERIKHHINQITEDNVAILGSLIICRLCARPVDENTAIDIFTDDLAQKINYTLPISVSPGDGLPGLICYECEKTLNVFHSFVCHVVKIDEQLKIKENKPSDQMTKTIAEIFGTDSDDDVKDPKMKNIPKRPISIKVQSKRLKIEETFPELQDIQIDERYICQRCGATCQEFEALIDHYKAQHSGKKLPCPEIDCEVRASNEELLKKHIQEFHCIPVLCCKCNKIFMNRVALQKHERNKHSAKVCNICCMTFEAEADHQTHVKLHNNGNKQRCIFCPKIYHTIGGLKRHTLNFHNGEVKLLMDNV